MERLLEIPDYDVATNGEYRTDVAHYMRKLEVLGLPEEQIKEMVKENAHIGNELAIVNLTRAFGDEAKAMERLEELIEIERVFDSEVEENE